MMDAYERSLPKGLTPSQTIYKHSDSINQEKYYRVIYTLTNPKSIFHTERKHVILPIYHSFYWKEKAAYKRAICFIVD